MLVRLPGLSVEPGAADGHGSPGGSPDESGGSLAAFWRVTGGFWRVTGGFLAAFWRLSVVTLAGVPGLHLGSSTAPGRVGRRAAPAATSPGKAATSPVVTNVERNNTS